VLNAKKAARRNKEAAWFARRMVALERKRSVIAAVALSQEAITLDGENVENWVDYGDLLVVTGRLEEARRAYETAIEMATKGVDPWWRMAAQNRLGDWFMGQGDPAKAQEFYQEARSYAYEHVQGFPNTVDRRRDWSISEGKFGNVYKAQSMFVQAKATYEAAREIDRQLVNDQPDNADRQRDLAVSLAQCGDLSTALQYWRSARKAFAESLSIRQKLMVNDPNNPDRQRDVAVIHDRLGNFAVAMKDFDKALEAYRSALLILDRLSSADSGHVGWQTDVLALNAKLALNGDNSFARWELVVDRLRVLNAENNLTGVQRRQWLPTAEKYLKQLQGCDTTAPIDRGAATVPSISRAIPDIGAFALSS
jgi:tetratricopeptide (TPR) repeat protein